MPHEYNWHNQHNLNLALFDLDNTLLAGDSDFEWAQFLIAKGVLDQELHAAKNDEFYRQYKEGTLDIHAFLDFQLAPLARHTRAELDAWHAEFMATRIRPIITAAARQCVAQHAANGDLLAIVTATNSFVTGPICRELGHSSPDRHRSRAGGRRFFRSAAWPAGLSGRQGRARGSLAGIAWLVVGQLRGILVLQRFAQ